MDTTLAIMQSLLVQLEGRVRTLENESHVTILINKKCEVPVQIQDCFQQYIKRRKEEPETDLGPPGCQCLSGALNALLNYEHKDCSPRLRSMLGGLQRLFEMLKAGGPDSARTWVKEMMMLPTFQKPGKEPKVRILFSCRGELVLPKDQADHEKMLKAIEQPEDDLHQLLPTEMPTTHLQLRGVRTPVETILAETMRSMGGQIMSGRAPRGNLVRQLGRGGTTK